MKLSKEKLKQIIKEELELEQQRTEPSMKDKFPEPSVFKTWPAVPSEVGNFKLLIVTEPVPFPDNSKLAFELFAVISF